MSIPARTVSPEALAEARRLYEYTRVPMENIATMLGISRSTLVRRVPIWGWVSRRKRIPPAVLPAAYALAAALPAGHSLDGNPSLVTPPDVSSRSRPALIARLAARIEDEIDAISRLVSSASLAAPREAVVQCDRVTRTVAVLTKNLRELDALMRETLGEAEDEDDDNAVRDPEVFRREVEEQLARLLKSGEAG